MKTGKPTVGLCLGMQTMTTAVFRHATGRTDVNLAEVDPEVAIRTFVPLAGAFPDRHQLGEQTVVRRQARGCTRYSAPTARSAAIIDSSSTSDLIASLESEGPHVTARSTDGAIAEGME